MLRLSTTSTGQKHCPSLAFQISILFCTLLLNGCTYLPIGTYFTHGTTQYRGDGTIRDSSQHSGLFSSRGYVITLEQFDLGGPYDKQFKLVNLPTIENGRVQISLAIEDEAIARQDVELADGFRKTLGAQITIILADSNGKTVTRFSSNIGRLVWSSPVHGYTGCWLYAEKDSFFSPRPGETYSLHVLYSPDSALQGKHGCIYLYSGCGGS